MLSGAVGDAAGSVLRLPAEVLCKRLQTTETCAGGEEGGLGLGGWHRALADIDTECWKAQSRAISAHLVASRFISRIISVRLGSPRRITAHFGSSRLDRRPGRRFSCATCRSEGYY